MNKLLQFILAAALFISGGISSFGQGRDIRWVQTVGGTNNDHGRAIQVDGAGNVYTLGHFSAPSATFGSATLTTTGIGTYLTKYSNTGAFLWARKISDTNITDEGALKTDAAGNSYVVTSFTGSTTLGSSLTSSGSSDIVIVKYNTSGAVLWATKAGGSAADIGTGITIDASGNSYITGSFTGTAGFGATNLVSAGGTDGFVAMLNASGTFVWAQKIGGAAADEGRGIAIDASSNVYVAGNFNGNFNLGITPLTHGGNQDMFLAAYDNSGAVRWARRAGSNSADRVNGLGIDAAGNLYIGGHFTGAPDFGNGVTISNSGNQDIFIAKYSSNGTSLWARKAGGNGVEELHDLHADKDGNLYLTGSYTGNNVSIGSTLPNSVGVLDIFAAQYDRDGNPVWGIGAGSALDDRGFGITSDASRNMYVTGYFQGNTTNFGGIVIPNRGGEETFISQLIPLLRTTSVTPAGTYCPGQTITVNYATSRPLGNGYRVQLSDANGSFANPTLIGSITNDAKVISATIPATTPAGTKYRIRVTNSNGTIIGADNGTDITINATPPAPELSASSPSAGGTLFLIANDIPGATYAWTGPNGFTSNLREPTRPNMRATDVGTYRLTVNVNGCTSTATIVVALSTVPTFDVDLRGNPNGVWNSESIKRAGSVCGDDNCVQFNIILDKNAGQIEFNLTSGGVPPGAMYYKINCGPQVNMGSAICVPNSGILTVTFCKPGNNSNTYQIRSIAAFEPQADVSLTAGCSEILRAPATFNEADIVWEDLTGNGAYLKYLSFPNGKKDAVVTGDENAPAFVDYRVSGTSSRSSCAPTLYYDDIRVFFHPKPVVTIGPTPAIICPGGGGVVLRGNVTGGDGQFNYIWTNAAGTQVGSSLDYTATTVGTYKFAVVPKNSRDCQEFSATVEVVSNLTANAGPDQLVCAGSTVQLAGAVTAATGGRWIGGAGTFSSRTALNATYTPTAAELSAGSVRLTLESTGNGDCGPVRDEVLITFYNMQVNLTGTPVVCNGTLGTITANVTGAQGAVTYRWSSGETTASIANKAAGNYTVTVTDSKGCAITMPFTITQVTGPTDFTAELTATSCGNSNGQIRVTGVTSSGNRTFQYSINGGAFQTGNTFTGLAAGPTYNITVRDANGCTFTKSFTLTDVAGPTAVSATAAPASCHNNDGSITAGAVIGGTGTKRYSINGRDFQDGLTFTGLASGTYTLTAMDVNGCTVTTSVTVGQETLTNFTATPAASTCGNANGTVTISAVVGGVGTLEYSKDGQNYQSSPLLTGFAAGPHTVWVKDARGCTFSKPVTVTNTPGPSDFAVDLKATTCGNSNGEIKVTGVTTLGNSTAYTYSLNGGAFQTNDTFTGLAAGRAYNITVRDANGCTFTKSFTLTDVAGPSAITASAAAASCHNNDGTITVDEVTGGKGTIRYALNNGTYQVGTTFTGLAAGTYTVTAIDGSSCTVSTTVTVTQTMPTDFIATPTAATCGNANGTVIVSGIVGGIGTYTYSKDGQNFQPTATLTGLAEGPHTITVKDARGCTFSKVVRIENKPGPSDFAFTANSSSCGRNNGSIVVGRVTGGEGTYTYSINGGAFQPANTFSNLRANTYRITVKDGNNCEFTKDVIVTDVAGPTNFAATVSNTTCGAVNGEITVTGVTGTAGGYKYSRDGVNFQDSNVFSGLAVGTHVITVRDVNGCTFSRTFTITNVAGPTAVAVTQQAASCQNNDGVITVGNVTGGTGTYTYSINGRDFQAGKVFNGLAAGSYTVTAKDGNGCMITRSVTVGTNVPTNFAFTTNPSTCGNSNGTITVGTVTGGSGTYEYSKDGVNFSNNNTLTGFSATTHTIWVRDSKGCVVSKQIAVSNEAGPSDILADATASSCGNPNGALTITDVTGVAGGYTYSIDGTNFQESTTFSNLLAGKHTITVKDANGCTFAKDFTVTDVAGPRFVAEAQSSTCGNSNGQIVVSNVSGGTGTYTYSLNGGAFQSSNIFANLAAGEYTVSVRDENLCVATQTIEVTNIPGPTDIALAAESSTCGSANGKITVTGVTTDGSRSSYTYAINGGAFQESATFTGLVARTYAITVKDSNGCTFTKEVEVQNIAGPDGITAAMTASTCGDRNGELRVTSVSGGTEDYTYSLDGVNFQVGVLFTGLIAGEYTITVKDARGCTFAQKFNVTNTGGPTAVTATSQPASCLNNDGSITVGTATGGTGTYTYSIDGTNFQTSKDFTGLASGDYTLTAKDGNGCTVTTAVKVNTNVPSNFAYTPVAATCGGSNGSIIVGAVTGGTGTYQYSKDGVNFSTNATLTGFAAGSHTIWVRDSKGCVFSKSVAVSNIGAPEFTVATDATTCGAANGRITVNGATGGVGPYTYSIDGSTFQTGTVFNNVLAGTYNVLVKDQNNCVGSVTVEVKDIAGPSDFVMTAVASTCGDSNATITVGEVTGGTAPFAYSLNGGAFQIGNTFANLAAGEYTITVQDDNGCEFVKTITVDNIPGPSDITLASTSSTCGSANGTISVTGVTGGTSSYTYSLNGGAFQSGTTFEAVLAGRYTVTVKDVNGCTFSKEIVVDNIAGPTDLVAETTSSTCGAANGEIRVTGVTGGTEGYTYSRDGVNFQVANVFTGLAAGNYSIRVQDANGCIVTKQVTVTNTGGPTAVAATFAPASCADNDGSITAGLVTGGKAPYTYSINGRDFQTGTGFAGLASGEYALMVKDDNGCIFTTTVTVTKDIPTTFAFTTTATTCGSNDGTITVGEVTGGFAPYTYSKDGVNFQTLTTLTGFVAGTHTITVKDAKGCIVTRQVQVSNVDGPSEFALAVTASTCGNSNGQFTIGEITGGTAPYTYSIDGSNFQSEKTFAALAARTYEVTVKDAKGCTYTQSVTIENIPGPSDFVMTVQSSSCGRANGTVTVGGITEGTAPYTYSKDGVNFQESATLTGLLAGAHTITVKDANGCTIAKVVTIEDVPGPSDMILASTSSTCGSANGTISVTGVTGVAGGYTYSIDGNNFQQGTTFENVLAGRYTVTVKDANGCTFSKEIVVDNIAGPTDLTVSAKASTCGTANGELTVTNVSGGTEAYSYSIDGVNFQAAATFTGLLAGSHTITVKDANGCTFAKAFTVSDIAGPSAVAASAQAATCADNDGRIIAGQVTGGTAPYTYSINGTTFQSETTFGALASGEYTLTVRDANGCETTTTVKVDKDGPGSFSVSTANATCGSDNGSIRVTSVNGGAAPYTYSLNGGAFQNGNSFSGLTPGEYTVTVKDANGCTHTETIQVRDEAGPTDLTASAQNTTCGNSNGQIQVSNVAGGTAPYTYSIDGTNFQTSTSFTGLAAGEYLLMVKDANGCTFTKAVIITNTDGPEGVVMEAKAATCGASNGSVVVGTVTGGTAPYTYSKDGVNFQTSTTLTGLAAGNQTIVVKDANGCTFSKAIVIENIAGPAGFEFVSTAATCSEANGSITIGKVTGGTAPYTYALNGGDFQSSTAFASVAAGEHTITVKDARGCTLDKKVVVESEGGPTAVTASATPASCEANDGTIAVGQVTGGTAPYTYSLDNERFQAAGTFAGLAPGEYQVYVKDANGCSTSTTITVGSKGPKEAAIAATAAKCGETNGTITVNGVTGGTAPYTYSINGGGFQASATFANLAAGSYEVTIRDAEGCTLKVTQNVVNSDGVESFTATGTDASCGERNGRIVISDVKGGTAPYTYSIDGTNFVSETTFTGLAEGDFQVFVKDASGCILIETVTIGNSPMLTDVKFSVSAASCGDAAGQVVVSEVKGGTAPYTYSLDGTNFSGSATLDNVKPGSYTLIVKDAKGCTFSVPVTVAGLSSKVAAVNHISCFGEANGSILIEATGGDANTEYSIDNGKTFKKNPSFTGLAKGTYQVVTRFSSTCTITLGAVEIREPELLQVTVEPKDGQPGKENSGSARVTVTGGTAPYTYFLDNGAGVSDSEFSDLSTGPHTIWVIDANGCRTPTETFLIKNPGEVDIPTGFTPNGDGKNDTWVIENLAELYPNSTVTVYNRWGSQVFESKGYAKPWDGTHKGKRLPDGTYYAIIEFGDDSRPAVKTAVTIMR